MSEPLDYASPPPQPLPHSELGNVSLTFTGIWIACLTGVMIGLRIRDLEHSAVIILTFIGGAITLVFVPLGLLTAIFAIRDNTRRRTNAYVSATINGTMVVLIIIRLSLGLMR